MKSFCGESWKFTENPVEMVHKLDLESRHTFCSFKQRHSYNYLNFLLIMFSEQKHILHISTLVSEDDY